MKQTNTKASSTAYEAIRSMIAQGQLCPGEELSERSLAESLQLGRTPVREAIKELCREGVLMSVPLRGTFVQRLSVEDLKEIHEVRLALEGMAAKLAAEKGGSPELRACMADLRPCPTGRSLIPLKHSASAGIFTRPYFRLRAMRGWQNCMQTCACKTRWPCSASKITMQNAHAW